MDMNAFYPYAIKEIFPNAEIIIDRFHIVHQLNRALNNKRIQVMKEQKNKESRHYTKLKRYWKIASLSSLLIVLDAVFASTISRTRGETMISTKQ